MFRNTLNHTLSYAFVICCSCIALGAIRSIGIVNTRLYRTGYTVHLLLNPQQCLHSSAVHMGKVLSEISQQPKQHRDHIASPLVSHTPLANVYNGNTTVECTSHEYTTLRRSFSTVELRQMVSSNTTRVSACRRNQWRFTITLSRDLEPRER